MSKIVSRANRVFSSGQAFMEAYDTPVPILGYRDVFEPQVTYLATLRNAISAGPDEMHSSLAVEEETIWQLRLFLDQPSEHWRTRLPNCFGTVTSRAFNWTFDPLRYYDENFNVLVAYDYELPPVFASLSIMYEHFSANCANYFDSETPGQRLAVNYHALFACQSHFTDCDVYIATKRLYATYILDHSLFLASEVHETQQSLSRTYFNFVDAAFDGGYGSRVDDIPGHHDCVEKLASYVSDMTRLWAETGEIVNKLIVLHALKKDYILVQLPGKNSAGTQGYA